MAKIDTISLSGNSFVNVGTESILGMIITNTDTEDVTFDLALGPKSLNGGTATTNAVFILKAIPIGEGATFIWDDEDVLNNAFGQHTIGVDTHVFRVSNRLGLAPGKTVEIVEKKLIKNIPDEFKEEFLGYENYILAFNRGDWSSPSELI